MLSYLNLKYLSSLSPNVQHNGGFAVAPGATQIMAVTGFPPPDEYTQYLYVEISNLEPTADYLILSMDNSPVNTNGVVIWGGTTYRLDLSVYNPFTSNEQLINGQPWPLGGNSRPVLYNPGANPVSVTNAWWGVM